MVAESIGVARRAGCAGTVIVRGDSAFYSAKVVAACRAGGAHFSVTARMDAKVKAAIVTIGEDEWIPIKYPNAIYDKASRTWISEAEVAEITYTAFTSTKDQAVTARLIVRRVKDRNKAAGASQGELFTAWRYHAVFTDSPYELIQAEGHHRDHAIVEQVFADLFDGPLAHLPSGIFAANAAWLTLAALTHNLTRAAGCLASTFHARARGSTIRRHLIAVPARLARHGRGHLTLHLPADWPWADAWINVFDATNRPPPARAA